MKKNKKGEKEKWKNSWKINRVSNTKAKAGSKGYGSSATKTGKNKAVGVGQGAYGSYSGTKVKKKADKWQ